MWIRFYKEMFPHFQKWEKSRNVETSLYHFFKKMTKVWVSIIVSIPHCPTVWNTNDDKIRETGQNQQMWKRLYIETFPHFPKIGAGRGSSIGSVSAWHASGPEFDPHVRHILSLRLGHEQISTAILPLPLIQEEQLSVTGERMRTKYWYTA